MGNDAAEMPVFGTIASQFNDPGTNTLFQKITSLISEKTSADFESTLDLETGESEKIYIIPPNRIRYLSEIVESNRSYDKFVESQSTLASKLFAFKKTLLFPERK